jgi:hypothetical protein
MPRISTLLSGVLMMWAGSAMAQPAADKALALNAIDKDPACQAQKKLEAEAPKVVFHIGDATLRIPHNYVDQSDGYQSAFNYVHIRALLPCLVGQTAENAEEFHRNEIGKLADGRLSLWSPNLLVGADLLKNIMERNNSLRAKFPDSITKDVDGVRLSLPNWTFYQDNADEEDVFFYPNGSDTTYLTTCSRRGVYLLYPTCQTKLIVRGSLYFEYRYSRDYIDKSPENSLAINNGLRLLITSFLQER